MPSKALKQSQPKGVIAMSQAASSADGHDLTAGDRRELRSVVKKSFAVLRNDVKRREQEMNAEVEEELLARYRQQDERIAQARRELAQAEDALKREQVRIAEALEQEEPSLVVSIREGRLVATDPRRRQLEVALRAMIPKRVAAALSKLDLEELALQRDLAVSALDTQRALTFLGSIPTVGDLVPKARLAEIEGPALESEVNVRDPWDEPPF